MQLSAEVERAASKAASLQSAFDGANAQARCGGVSFILCHFDPRLYIVTCALVAFIVACVA